MKDIKLFLKIKNSMFFSWKGISNERKKVVKVILIYNGLYNGL